MKLYAFSGSCALATNIVLEWTGAPYTVELIEKDDLDKPEMRKLSPWHQVPVLDIDGWVLDQNVAILGYLADKFPEAKLIGDGSLESRAEVNRWLAVINADMHPAFKPLFGATNYLGDDTAIEKSKDHARGQLREYFERINQQLEGRDFLAGSRSIADPYLFVLVRWSHAVKVDISGLTHLQQFEQRMRADPAVQRALKAQGIGQAA
jgi:glutathione S-transferase